MLPALEVAIGLAVMFLVIALASSSLVEVIGTTFKLRANGLERTVRSMLGTATPGQEDVAAKFVESAVVTALREADTAWTIMGRPKRSRSIKIEQTRKLPSQMPARAFADGLVGVLTDIRSTAKSADELYMKLPSELRDRLKPILDETGLDIVAFKARVEQWFDDAMEGLDHMYKKWSKKILFIVGLSVTVALNASAVHVAEQLWANPIERAAVVAAVDDIVNTPPGSDPTGKADSFAEVADQISSLDSAGIPVGWDGVEFSLPWLIWSLLGWTATALLVMRGAPFWYDMLGRLFAMRKGLTSSAGGDPASATSQVNDETRRNSRSTYLQLEGTRSSVATPPSSPAERLFQALPLRTS